MSKKNLPAIDADSPNGTAAMPSGEAVDPPEECPVGSLYERLVTVVERRSLAIALTSLGLGMTLAALWPRVGQSVADGVGWGINAYGLFVPFLLYFLLSSALVKMVDLVERHGSGWVLRVILQFVLARILAILFAIGALAFVFQIPFTLDSSLTPLALLKKVGGQLVDALIGNPFLYGVYGAILTVPVACRWKRLKHCFVMFGDWIESAGQFLVLMTPVFMLTCGAFFTRLPEYAAESLSSQGIGAGANIIGLLHVVRPEWIPERFTFVWMYFVLGGTTAALCFAWHTLYVVFTWAVEPRFSVKRYLTQYWIKVYPLLWASSSETLAVPLSLARMKVAFPEVPASLRQFVIAGGSYLGINGTLICVYVMGVMLAKFVGSQICVIQLLVSLPVIFLLGYAVPGVPGELVIFADTMALILGIPPTVKPLFLALYLTMQVGLPDSFRTGCNSTDSALLAIVSSRNLGRTHVETEPVLDV